MKALRFFVLGCLLLIGGQVYSQNGTTPFVNSTHNYSVNGGAVGNYQWSVLLANGNPATADDFTMVDGTTATAKITWLKANVVGVNDNYIVQLEETDGNSCSTIRQFVVTVIGNAFDISIADLTATCSDASGTVIVNSTNDNLGTTSKTFTIDMSTATDMATATFKPDWKFEYEVTSTSGDLVSVTFDDNTSVASPSLAGKTATGEVTVNNDDYSVQVTVVFNNTWNSGDLVTVTLSKGVELTYNTPDGLDTNNTGSITINALPATTNITTD